MSKMKHAMQKHILLIALLLFTAAAAVGCSPSNPQPQENRITVTVSILPQKYFVERIGGEDVTVNVMVGPGESPHSYEPKPEQMRMLNASSVYFRIGVEFEGAWLPRIASANPDMRIVDLSAGIQKLPMQAFDHEEEGEDDHDEDGLDPHVWTSPQLVRGMADQIYQELTLLNPQRDSYYKANLTSFISDIDTLEGEMRAAFSPLEKRKFMVFHPSWGYFARDFGLEQVAIEIGGTEPSASQLAALLDLAKAERIQVIFAQPEFSTRSAETIAREVDASVILISPLAEDWLENLREVARSLAGHL